MAFGIAGQLRRQGHEVSLLALFDTVRPGARAGQLTRFLIFLRKIKFHLGQLRELPPKRVLTYVLRMGKREISKLISKTADKFYRGIGSSLPHVLRNLTWANKQAAAYIQEVYPGRVTLFRAADQALCSYPDPLLGWGELFEGEVEIHVIPGAHNSMWQEPNVRILAEKLSDCLREAHTRHHINDGGPLPG